ncbi:MAG: ATP-binding cassette domain-containing protein [Planctomycetota bacterium]|nr:MAG: ATP-binding cassette domain-containing protein [Planctomycetota bacterium]
MPFLSVTGLARSFGRSQVLVEAGFDLERGGRLTIAGRSGSGKTTLLRILAGLERADRGVVRFDGVAASDGRRILLPPWRRPVQMVFQDLGLWPNRSVRRHLLDPLAAQGVPRAEARSRTRALLARLGLAPLARRRPGRLSGGEARRLAFARALAPEPELLLLDEPFASLDPVARAEGLALLDEVLAATRAAVVLVTHDPAEARALGGEVAVLRRGRLAPPRPAVEVCADDETFRRELAES